jgi:ATP-dependent helicase/nuclease subunit B
VLDWSERLGEAVVRPEPGDALLVAATPADALSLAADLAGLIDTLAIEGRDFEDVKRLVPEGFDRYWQVTTQFLAIAAETWPQALAERGLADVALRRDRLIRARAALYRAGGDEPVIAAGSTGSMPATAELIAAIARLPRGAAVLPGLDTDLDEASFAAIAGDPAAGIEASPGHPQALLRRLLSVIGIARDAVTTLGALDAGRRARARLLSEAMRPAATTDAWATPAADAAETIAQGLEDVSIVTAADEREEALAIAVALREAIETPGKTAALVTPDRDLAERVAASLGRWRRPSACRAGR